jgi:nucleoside-diphosphate-sugar epimerase
MSCASPGEASVAVSADSASVLATGGTGLVGRSIVRRLLAAGRSVRIISRGGDFPAHPGVSICRGDVTCDKDLAAALHGCDAVIHCAAEKRDAQTMESVNVTATRLLFDMARDSKVSFFCHLSSVGVIGRTRARIVDEATPCHPMNRYTETKLAAEDIVKRGLPGGSVVILRPTNVFGAETLAPWLQDCIRSRVRQFLTGREKSHLIYVEDVAATAVHWLQASGRQPVDTFIVSSDEESGNSWGEVQAALASMIETAPGPSTLSAPLWMPYLARRIRHGDSNPGELVYSSNRLRQAGFRIPYGLRSGLADAVSLWRRRLAAP